MPSYPIEDMYEEYKKWCENHGVPSRAILTPRQYEQQALAFLLPNSEHSEHDADRLSRSARQASSDDRSVPSKC